MLDLPNSLIVCSSLLLLMLLVAGSWGGMAVTGRMGVENPYIKKASCSLSPQKPCAMMSSLCLYIRTVLCPYVRIVLHPYVRTVLRPYVRTVLRPYVSTVLRPYVRTVLCPCTFISNMYTCTILHPPSKREIKELRTTYLFCIPAEQFLT